MKMAQGISIHIGINEVDETHYGKFESLNFAVRDAQNMADLAESADFNDVFVLADKVKRPESKDVISKIENAAKKLIGGDILLVTFSGHGAQITGNFEEPYDQTWCLKDRQIFDDELGYLWSTFEKGVRIFFISDSCHSGTMATTKFTFLEKKKKVKTRFSKSRIKRLRTGEGDFIVNKHPEIYVPVIQDLKQKLIDSGSSTFKEAIDKKGVKVISISACQDFEDAIEDNNNGVFTAALKQVWYGVINPTFGAKGVFKGDYKNFFEEVKKITMIMNKTQQPNCVKIGQEVEDFEQQQVFKI